MEKELADAASAVRKARDDRGHLSREEYFEGLSKAGEVQQNIQSKTDVLWEYQAKAFDYHDKQATAPAEYQAAISQAFEAHLKAQRNFRSSFKPEVGQWRSPRRDVMLAAGVLCLVADRQQLSATLSATQLAILREVFAAALDPHTHMSLDAVGERILSMIPDT